jgi:hypothetical protein
VTAAWVSSTARHLRLNRPVALKMLLSGACASRHELARFVREAEAVAGLEHPHIVQLHDVGDLDGQPYFTTELIFGASLAQSDPKAGRGSLRLTLTRWQNDSDLACVRDAGELEKLSADERDDYVALWADVSDLLSRAEK